MARDGRGNPGRIVLKNLQPRLQLREVLRRRRSTLKKLLDELGIFTYTGLENWCLRMGIAPPEREEFELVVPPTTHVNSPQEGVVVLQAPVVIHEHSGERIDVSSTTVQEELDLPTDDTQKKRKPKKDKTSNEG